MITSVEKEVYTSVSGVSVELCCKLDYEIAAKFPAPIYIKLSTALAETRHVVSHTRNHIMDSMYSSIKHP